MNGDDDNHLVAKVRRERERQRVWRDHGAPSLGRYIGQIGVLGWIVVTPTLLGVLGGRWLDHTFKTGVFWTAPLVMIGAAIGLWSAWKWMQRS